MSIHHSPMEWFDLWVGAVGGDFERKLWISLFFVVMWSLWNQRNSVVFDKSQTDWVDFCYVIKFRLCFWLKGWNQDAPFSPGEVVTKLDCVKMWRKRKEPRHQINWSVPPSNRIK